jgi:hypothetical protein
MACGMHARKSNWVCFDMRRMPSWKVSSPAAALGWRFSLHCRSRFRQSLVPHNRGLRLVSALVRKPYRNVVASDPAQTLISYAMRRGRSLSNYTGNLVVARAHRRPVRWRRSWLCARDCGECNNLQFRRFTAIHSLIPLTALPFDRKILTLWPERFSKRIGNRDTDGFSRLRPPS